MRFASAVLAAALAFAAPAGAQEILVPPNDPAGHVFSTLSNDGWSGSRGVVFTMQGTGTLTGVALWHDLTNITVEYEVAEVASASGDLSTGKVVLRSGSALVTTAGLQFVVFPFASLALANGSSYHVRFRFDGLGNQNFFYDNSNVTFTQGPFTLVDGTNNEDTGNSVMPRVRLDGTFVAAAAPATPVPATSSAGLAMLAAVLAAVAIAGRRRIRR